MAITPGFENPQTPSYTSEAFVPDQLIYSTKNLVSSEFPCFLTGSAPLPRGTILGKTTAPTLTGAAKTGGNTGNGTISAVSAGEYAQTGVYSITLTSPTAFNVLGAPNSSGIADSLGSGVVGTPFSSFGGVINFLLTAGSTAFVAGDGFTITNPGASGLWKLSVATASDGSQKPSGVLVDYADPTSGNVNIGVYVSGEFNIRAVTYDSSWTQAPLVDACRASRIDLKNSISGAAVTLNA